MGCFYNEILTQIRSFLACRFFFFHIVFLAESLLILEMEYVGDSVVGNSLHTKITCYCSSERHYEKKNMPVLCRNTISSGWWANICTPHALSHKNICHPCPEPPAET